LSYFIAAGVTTEALNGKQLLKILQSIKVPVFPMKDELDNIIGEGIGDSNWSDDKFQKAVKAKTQSIIDNDYNHDVIGGSEWKQVFENVVKTLFLLNLRCHFETEIAGFRKCCCCCYCQCHLPMVDFSNVMLGWCI
jgi:hypothetical protein